jgi:hypothetical protein
MITKTQVSDVEKIRMDVNIYRTKWLLAHNRLHDILHEDSIQNKEDAEKYFEEYLHDLNNASKIASQQA